jgi:hypothetical protein
MKVVKQIELLLEHEPGSLSAVSDLLGGSGVNIIAFYVAAENDKGKLRFVANDPEKAMNVLKTAGYKVKASDVIACETPHHPGGLNAVLKPLQKANLNVDYIYPCIGTGKDTFLILGVAQLKQTLKVMEENWIRVLGDELYNV